MVWMERFRGIRVYFGLEWFGQQNRGEGLWKVGRVEVTFSVGVQEERQSTAKAKVWKEERLWWWCAMWCVNSQFWQSRGMVPDGNSDSTLFCLCDPGSIILFYSKPLFPNPWKWESRIKRDSVWHMATPQRQLLLLLIWSLCGVTW